MSISFINFPKVKKRKHAITWSIYFNPRVPSKSQSILFTKDASSSLRIHYELLVDIQFVIVCLFHYVEAL